MQEYDRAVMVFIQSALPCLYSDIIGCICSLIIDDFRLLCIDKMLKNGYVDSLLNENYKFSWKLYDDNGYGNILIYVYLHVARDCKSSYYIRFLSIQIDDFVQNNKLHQKLDGWYELKYPQLNGIIIAIDENQGISDDIIKKYTASAQELLPILRQLTHSNRA